MRFFANLHERALHEFRCLATQAEAAFGPTDMASFTAARAAAAALNAADWMLSTLDTPVASLKELPNRCGCLLADHARSSTEVALCPR